MELTILWTDFAKSELSRIYKYLKDQASPRIARNETKKIARATIRLKKQPEIGKVEELLNGGGQEFRYLVHQSYKIIYWINWNEKQVVIMDVFQTNQYPEKMKRTK